MEKNEARKFLGKLEEALVAQLSHRRDLTAELDDLVARRDKERDKHLFRREAAFVNVHVVPPLFAMIAGPDYLGDQQAARRALRNEHLTGMEAYTESTGAWLEKHPFSKKWPGNPLDVYREWAAGAGLKDCWPDITLHDEKLPTVAFECKYFVNGSASAAKAALVRDLYQAVFYRGLPSIPRAGQDAGWSCAYACLIAYDASPAQTLITAWNSLPDPVKTAFWDGASVYPMFIGASR